MLGKLLKLHTSVDPTKMRAPDFLHRQQEIEQEKVRAIESHAGWRSVDACPVCQTTARTTEFLKYNIELAECNNCSARYGTKIPANLDDVYRRPGYVAYSLDDVDAHYNYRRERFGRERVAILEKHCGDMTEKRLLDIGCGNGYFLSVAMEKCQHCFGTEFSDRMRDFAHKKTGLTIYNRGLEELPEASYDIITLFDVIEHIPDPIPFLRSVDRILRRGGNVLIFTPNFDSFSLRVMREQSSIADPTEHVILYTLPSLEYLGKRVGWSTTWRETQGMDIQNIQALHMHNGAGLDPFLSKWNDELQAMINSSLCGDYGRILYTKH